MRNKDLYEALESWMNKNCTPTDVMRSFERRWWQLRDQDAYPCPNCFVEEGGEQALVALERIGTVEPVVCPKCRERYYVRVTK